MILYDLEVRFSDGERTALRLVDLPGYGYAQVAKQERGQWQKLIEDYLIHSRQLRGVVIIVEKSFEIRRSDRKLTVVRR